MRRFVVAASVAVAIGLGAAGKADAQIVYGYSVPNAGGVVTGNTVVAPGAYQTYNTFYSPLTGVMARQTYYTDVLGNSYGRMSTYSPWLGLGYKTGYYQPNPFINPYGGYSYSRYYGRGW